MRKANQKSNAMTSSEIFEGGTFYEGKISQNGRSEAGPGLAPKQDFAYGKSLKPIVKKCKCLTCETY